MSRPFISGACRAALLMMSRAPLAYGRTLIAVEALHELTYRSFREFVRPACSVFRCTRMERVITGRQKQIYELLRDAGHLSVAWPFSVAVDAMGELHARVQMSAAAAAFDSVLRGAAHV